ncbi:MAG: glycosyltransferase family 4 protein [Bacteroidales bacterium]|nr:glycosyltransferase family 4 protein [Bacteroidales bacterium]
MFGWEFPPHITGGLGTACFGLTKGLLKCGVDVQFVVPKAYGDESQEAVRIINASDVTVMMNDPIFREYWSQITYMEIGSNLIPYVGPEDFQQMVSENLNVKVEEGSRVFSEKFQFSGKYGHDLMEEVARYALVGAAIAANSEFDVIHAHDWLTYSAGVAAKKISGKPLVVHMHATEFDRSGENYNENVYEIERKGMAEADRVITVSNLTRNIVIERYHIDPDKVITVHNAVEPPEKAELIDAQKHVKEKIVTFLGRITFQKGPEYFIEAACKVLEKDKNVRFVMAGTGDMMEKMIRRVAKLKISSHFHFTGFLKGENVDRMFAMSDVYVMPSVSEPFGISPLEAMRSNVPVIISKQSGVAEVLDHVMKVDFWDVDAMADAIYGLLHYKSMSDMTAANGAEEVNNLKWEAAARKVADIYESLV